MTDDSGQMTVAVRAYEARDHDAVWALHREGVADGRAEYPEIDHSGYEQDLGNIEGEYLSPGSNFWVVEIGLQLVGMAALQRIDDSTGRLRRMRVTSAWRRKGVATDLLKTAEEFCRQQGYGRLILDTTAQQAAAQRLYEGAGFVRTGERSLGPYTVYDYVKELA
jgi:GNAT superfamily N-acetyltransferase